MFGIDGPEFLIIILVAVLVLGPEHLPRVMRTVTKIMGDFRRISTDFQRTLNLEAHQEEFRKQQEALLAPVAPKKKKKKKVVAEAPITAEAPTENSTAATQDASSTATENTSPTATDAAADAKAPQAEATTTSAAPDAPVDFSTALANAMSQPADYAAETALYTSSEEVYSSEEAAPATPATLEEFNATLKIPEPTQKLHVFEPKYIKANPLDDAQASRAKTPDAQASSAKTSATVNETNAHSAQPEGGAA